MGEETDASPNFRPNRRWRIGLQVAVGIAAFLALVIMVNYLAARHFKRLEWAVGSRPELSPVTLRILREVTNTVKVVVFYDRKQPLYGPVTELLSQFKLRCPRLELEHVDYTRFLGRAEEIQAAYDLDPAERGDRIIFASHGKKRIIYSRELSEFDYSQVFTERKVKRTAFKGEQLFASAISRVIDPRATKAYFLAGHGEHDPNDSDEQRGYSDFARVLHDSNIDVGSLSLLTNDLPADCQLLIVANPENPISSAELEKIERYLNQGGRLLALFGLRSLKIQSGIERLLANWGVSVGRNWVTDSLQSKSGEPGLVVVTEFADHPLARPLRRSRLALTVPRSIGRLTSAPRSADAARIVELAKTSPAGIAHHAAGGIAGKGAIPLIVTVEKGSVPGITADRGETRIVAVGDSLFWGNTGIDWEANRDFARLAVYWLVNRDVLLEGVGARPIKEYTITMTRSQMKTVRWLLVAGLPGLVLVIGFLVWARRRS